MPGRLVNHSGRHRLRLPLNWPWAHTFTTALQQIRNLPQLHLSRPQRPAQRSRTPPATNPHQPHTPILHAPKRAGPHTRTSPAATRPQPPIPQARRWIQAETVRKWVRRTEVDEGRRLGLSSEERERLERLERENRELRRANEILKSASVHIGFLEPSRKRCFYVCQVLILGCWRRR